MRTHSRREFLAGAASSFSAIPRISTGNDASPASQSPPPVDYHVHLNPGFSLEDAVAVSRERGVKFGSAEHAGTKANQYPVILSNDQELQHWIARLDGKPVFRGIQAEWIDCTTCFSKDLVVQLDDVLLDAMTIPDRTGQRVNGSLASTGKP
jgi:hypothetical protein